MFEILLLFCPHYKKVPVIELSGVRRGCFCMKIVLNSRNVIGKRFELANVRVIGGLSYRGCFCMKIVLNVQGECKISLT